MKKSTLLLLFACCLFSVTIFGNNYFLNADSIVLNSQNVLPNNTNAAFQTNPPTATTDSIRVKENSIDNVIDALTNDMDADGDPLAIFNLINPLNGTAVLTGSGSSASPVTGSGSSILYTPNTNYIGLDSLYYSACDPDLQCDEEKVFIKVVPNAPWAIPSQTQYNLTSTDCDEVVTLPLTLLNDGCQTLTWNVGTPTWIQASTSSGSLIEEESTVIMLAFNMNTFNAGMYTAVITLTSNDPRNPSIPINVSLTKSGTPTKEVTPSSIDFGMQAIGSTTSNQDILIKNVGCDTLLINSHSTTTTIFSSVLTVPVKIPPGQSQALPVSFSPTAANAYTDNLTIVTNDGTATVALAGIACPPAPVISLQSGSTILCGTSDSRTLTSDVTSNIAWSTGATTPSITVSQAGTYTVTYFDANGCTATSNAITLTQSSLPIITLSAEAVSCFGASDGQIMVTNTSGGTAPYQYVLGANAPQNSTEFSNLAAGTYTIEVVDANGCTGSKMITVQEPAIISFSDTQTNVTDCNLTNGSITITASGGSGTYEYNFGSGWQASNTKTGLAAGQYLPKVRNANGTCEVTGTSVTITKPIPPSIANVTSTNVTNCNLTNGSITITASGGSGTYEYNFGSGWQASNTKTGLAAGQYLPKVRNANGTCEVTGTAVVITQPTPPNIANVVSADLTNCNAANGSITITATGGSGTYEYNFGSGWQASNTKTGLAAGQYTPKVRNANGTCEITGTIITLTEPIPPTISDVAVVQLSNCSTTDGSITVTASGVANTAICQAATLNLNGTVAVGNYQAANTITSAGTINGGTTVSMKAGQSITLQAGFHAKANSDFLAAIETCTNNQTILQYSFNNGETWQNNPSRSGLSAGTYIVKVRNADGTCVTTAETVVIADPPAPTVQNVTDVQISNCGANNGSITINATGGIAPLEYSFDNGGTYQTSPTKNNLSPGAYQLKIRNANNTCEEFVQIISMLEPAKATATFTKTNSTSCGANDGTITITASGGRAPLEYSFDNGQTWGTAASKTGLAPNSYLLKVRNSQSTNCITNVGTATIADGVDTSPPIVVVNNNFTLQLNTNGTAFLTPQQINNGTSDACSGVTALTLSKNSFSCADVGTNTIIFTATDGVGLSSSTTVQVQVLASIDCLDNEQCTRNDLVLITSSIASQTYWAKNTITSSGTVVANSAVTFKAGTSITLRPGFHARAQSDFLATIEACPTALQAPTATVAATSRNTPSAKTRLVTDATMAIRPNPFFTSTTIEFELSQAQPVQLAIYSSTQQLIKVLEANKVRAVGKHTYEFSANDLMEGMYFVVLTTGEQVLTKKMILLR